jgi:transcriptional regulator
MYIPNHFNVNDEIIIDHFLRKHSFVTLVATSNQLIEAVHVPVIISQDRKNISFHIAEANPIKNFLILESTVLMIFTGPHGYVSPRWYTKPNVPTWNYTAIHVYGRVQKVLDQRSVLQDLEKLVLRYESKELAEKMFVGSDMPIIAKQVPAIIGYEIEVSDIQAKFKLSQNRDQMSRDNVIKELRRSNSISDKELGDFMTNYFEKQKSEG